MRMINFHLGVRQAKVDMANLSVIIVILIFIIGVL